jgi:TolA-binding protein
MFEEKEFLSVSEAVLFTGKSDKTIRYLIKELLEVEKTSGSDVKTSRSASRSQEEVELLHEWLEDKNIALGDLRKRLDSRELEIERLYQLLENQQKMAMHSQLQLENNQKLLEQKQKPKGVLGLFAKSLKII